MQKKRNQKQNGNRADKQADYLNGSAYDNLNGLAGGVQYSR